MVSSDLHLSMESIKQVQIYLVITEILYILAQPLFLIKDALNTQIMPYEAISCYFYSSVVQPEKLLIINLNKTEISIKHQYKSRG